MKLLRPIRSGLLIAMTCCAMSIAAAAGGEAALVPQIEAIATYRFGESREPLTAVEDMVRASLGNRRERAALAARLGELLDSDATLECKQFVCRQLAVIGADNEVRALAPLLEDAATADMARYALERIPGAKADAALLDALSAPSSIVKIGVVNSLGNRGCSRAVGPLSALVFNSDPEMADAAVGALGRIGSVGAARALASAARHADPVRRRSIEQAQLTCADRLAQSGRARYAARIYKDLHQTAGDPSLQAAAFYGLVAASGYPRNTDLVLEGVGSGDPKVAGIALRFVRELPGPRATRRLAQGSLAFPPETRARVIRALGERGDSAARPVVIQALEDEDAGVRIAALESLGLLGDASAVMLLAGIAAHTAGEERSAARRSLHVLSGTGVDETVIEGINSEIAPSVRVELVHAAAARGLCGAVPALLNVARLDPPDLRTAAYEALGGLAREADLVSLLSLFDKEMSDTDRTSLELAVVEVSRGAEAPSAATATLLNTLAASTEKDRVSLLRILGELAQPEALPFIRAAIEDDSAEVAEAAVRALAGWPDAAVLDDLLRVVQGDRTPEPLRSVAFDGYVRLLTLPYLRSSQETARLFEQVLEIARTIDEKRAALSSLSEIGSLPAFRLAARYLSDADLRSTAARSALAIARTICGAYRREVVELAPRIQQAARDEFARVQLQEVLDTIQQFEDYIVAWEVSGPYLQPGKSGRDLFDMPFPPEDPQSASASWSVMPIYPASNRPYVMDLGKAIGGNDRAAYLRTRVISPIAQGVQAELGSDDGVKVWVNGSEVHANNASRGCEPGQDRFPVKLDQGENTILVKVVNGGSDWAVCLRLRAPDGSPLTGLDYRID